MPPSNRRPWPVPSLDIGSKNNSKFPKPPQLAAESIPRTTGANMSENTYLEIYGVPVHQDVLAKALDNASTIRDTSDHVGNESLNFESYMHGDNSGSMHNDGDIYSVEVEWDGRDDREDQRKMSNCRKWVIVAVLAVTTLQITLCSSIWSQSSDKIRQEFKVSNEVATLGLTLYMIGIAVGPLFSSWSEYFGRKPIYFVGFLVYIGLQLLTVLGDSFECLLIGRFFTGFAGGIIISTAYGTLGDLFSMDKMGSSVVVLTITSLVGPLIAPVISSFVSAFLSFQWVFRIMVIWSGIMALLVVAVVPETYGPLLLIKKAKRIRATSRNNNFYAPMEKDCRSQRFTMFFANFVRSFEMLFCHAIIFYLCLYCGLIMGILYSFFTAFPVVFVEVYQFKSQFLGFPFLGIASGMVIAACTQPFWEMCYRKLTLSNHGQDEAEYWMPQLAVGGVFVPGGLFIFGWTNFETIPAIVPMVGAGVFGFGTLLVFTSVYLYIVDGYRKYCVSGIAANMFVAGICAALFPLFGEVMFTHIGFHWSPSIFGIITACCIPIPLLLFERGTYWRDRSRFSCNVTP